MKKFTIHEGTFVPVLINDIDTDQLIPKQYLKGTEKTGYADVLFDAWRYEEDGSPRASFPLNQEAYQGASILLAGSNFGCGSSREHAAWALQDYGFEVIIAGSYSPIFYMNWLNNGHLPIVLPQAAREEMAALPPGTKITVDLPAQTVTAREKVYSFDLETSWKERLLEGQDAIDRTLSYESQIADYERTMPVWQGGNNAC